MEDLTSAASKISRNLFQDEIDLMARFLWRSDNAALLRLADDLYLHISCSLHETSHPLNDLRHPPREIEDASLYSSRTDRMIWSVYRRIHIHPGKDFFFCLRSVSPNRILVRNLGRVVNGSSCKSSAYHIRK